MPTVTPSLLFDYLQCPHKVWRDLYGPMQEFVEGDSEFLRLLWERGIRHEEKIVDDFAFVYVDCRLGTEVERINRTNVALAGRAEYIYQGILDDGDLFGIPDLLHWDGSEYYPIEIKSGSAEEGSGDTPGKLKKHYAVQLALYSEILQRRGLQRSARGVVIDGSGQRFDYDLTRPQGANTPETHWELYKRLLSEVLPLLSNETQNDPANCGACKNCGWYYSCKKWCETEEDLTQLFELGRSKRDVIKRDLAASKLSELVNVDREMIAAKKKADKGFLKGIGAGTIEKFIFRSQMLIDGAEPHVYQVFDFPDVRTELFFDIESDPTQDFIYLHGFWVKDDTGERFVHFTARESGDDAEKNVWAEAVRFIRSFDIKDLAIYYYSPYERVSYRRLSIKYPGVISETELDELFAHHNVIDLYEVVKRNTEWPLGSYGIKAIAQYLQFKWRDETPSGALSIQWYNDFLATGDEKFINRVLEYNEDDCKATMVVKDYLKQRMDDM